MVKKLVFGCCLLALTACASSAHQATGLQTQTLIKGTTSWDGQPLPPYSKGQPEVTILKITIPAHATLPLHQHPFINAGVLLSGQLTVITEQEDVLQLKAGDPLIEVVNKWHYGVNEGETDAQILVFYAGEVDKPVTIKSQR